MSFWKDPTGVGRPVDIMIPDDKMTLLVQFFMENGLEAEIVVKDVQE